MRRGQKPRFLEHEGVLVGVNLGADFCAEHEWGIKKIARSFGLPTTEQSDMDGVFGPKRLTVTEVPTNILCWQDDGNEAFLICSDGLLWRQKDAPPLSVESLNKDRYYGQELSLPSYLWEEMDAKRSKKKFTPPVNQISGAWAEDSFGVHVKGAEFVGHLKAVYDAMLQKDLCIFLGGATLPVFENPGLQLVIASRIPEDGAKIMAETQREKYQVKMDAEKTGIADRLKTAGIRYFALSPRRARGDENTKHPVIFWLNPMEQQIYDSGWATVEDLDELIAGRGRFIKATAART